MFSLAFGVFGRRPRQGARHGRRFSGGGLERGRTPIRLTPPEHRPERARRLVRDGDRGDVYRAPGHQRLEPGPRLDLLAERGAQHRPCAMDQERSEIPVAALAGPTDVLSAATRGDAWRQSGPSGEMARRSELGAVADRSDQRRRRQRFSEAAVARLPVRRGLTNGTNPWLARQAGGSDWRAIFPPSRVVSCSG